MTDPDLARKLATDHLQRNDATGWFEVLYASANANFSVIPWADLKPNINLVTWLEREKIAGSHRRAIVIGCGLGDDAEELARRGFSVTAFDIAPTAIEWSKRRFPGSAVQYTVGDLLNVNPLWTNAFDFVFESYTIQALPQSLRTQAIQNVANLLAPAGQLLLICRGRNDDETAIGPPWPLSRSELSQFKFLGLTEQSFEDFPDPEEPATRRFRAVYLRLPSRSL